MFLNIEGQMGDERRAACNRRNQADTMKKQDVYQCRHCAYSTTLRTNYEKHFRTHAGEKAFPCPYCSYQTSDKSYLTKHIRIHTGEKPFFCPHCPYRATRSDSLKNHLRNHSFLSIYLEKIRGMVIYYGIIWEHTLRNVWFVMCLAVRFDQPISRMWLDNDIQSADEGRVVGRKATLVTSRNCPETYYCPHCTYNSVDHSEYLDHFRTHMGGKTFSCPQCSYQTLVSSNFKRHIRIHTGEKPYFCPYCPYRSNEKAKVIYKSVLGSDVDHKPIVWLSNDMRMSGAGEVAGARNIVINNRKIPKFYHCPSCTFTSSNRSHFSDHYRTHTVKHFLQVWRDSDTQMLDGGGVAWNLNCRQARKVYNCTLCSYRTPSRSDIDKHIRTHTGEKPFSCPHCLYQTANKSNLKRHMRTHTAENIHL
ncbi:zinc finger protein 26-like [Penaeus japonicus]|uniref:zinc finger protein 26-like n=1 Tax=Penaeus japonicus TaxID=27405 RepID=UPI001C70E458|nr:zinc finger protein 26-like [Penaeus japonicus]